MRCSVESIRLVWSYWKYLTFKIDQSSFKQLGGNASPWETRQHEVDPSREQNILSDHKHVMIMSVN